MATETKMYKAQISQNEDNVASNMEEIRSLEKVNIDLKTRVTVAEADAARLSVENQKLLQVLFYYHQ